MSETKKQRFKQGEKILFGIAGVFIVVATLSFVGLEVVRARSDSPLFESKTSYDFTPIGLEGSRIFRESQCTSCHRAMRNGTNMGLSLDGVGSRRSLEWLEQFLLNPEQTYDSVTIDHGKHPKEAAYVSSLPSEQRHAIATFLSQLRADQGSPSAQMPPVGRSDFIDNMIKMWAPDSWKEKYQDVRESGGAERAPVGSGEGEKQ